MVVNTDGWVTGDIAVSYKTQLVKELKPDVIVGVQVEDELRSIIAYLDNIPVILVEAVFFLLAREVQKNAKSYAK